MWTNGRQLDLQNRVAPYRSGNIVETLHKVRLFDYNVYVPMDYWSPKRPIVPPAAQARVDQMRVFYNLYRMDFSDLQQYPAVPISYFKEIVSTVVSLLTMYGPDITVAGREELPVSGRYYDMLMLALRTCIQNMPMHGTGLMRVSVGRWGPEVHGYMPIYWFPHDRETDTLINPMNGYTDLWQDSGYGVVKYKRYAAQEVADAYRVSAASVLGELARKRTAYIGYLEGWETIQRLVVGRPGVIINALHDVSYGDWGESIYPEITPTAINIAHRLTELSAAQDDHSTPALTFKRYRDPSYPDDYRESQYRGTGMGQLEVRMVEDYHNSLRSRRVFDLPVDIEEAKYVQGEIDIEGQLMYVTKLEDIQGDLCRIPPSFMKELTGGPVSGVALSKRFVKTHAYIKDIIKSLTAPIYRAILIGAMLEGATPSELEDIYGGLDVRWPTIFDSDGGESEDITPGSEDGSGGGARDVLQRE